MHGTGDGSEPVQSRKLVEAVWRHGRMWPLGEAEVVLQ